MDQQYSVGVHSSGFVYRCVRMHCIAWLKQKPRFGVNMLLIAAATVPTFLTAVASSFGTVQQKGTVLGIFRSVGALARAFGPVVASCGKHCM